MSDELTRTIAEALGCEWAKAPGYEYCAEHGFSEKDDAWPCPETRKTVAALAPAIEARERAVRAETLSEAAEVWGEGQWQEQWAADHVEDDVSAVRSTVRWLRERAEAAARGE